MPITRTAMIDDDGSGITGTILNNAWKQEIYNQIDALVAPYGIWQVQPFNASDYTGITVAAEQVQSQFTQLGKTVVWNFDITNATVIGTPASIVVRIPPTTAVAAGSATFLCNSLIGGAWVACRAGITIGLSSFGIGNINYANIPAGAFYFQGTLIYEIV